MNLESLHTLGKEGAQEVLPEEDHQDEPLYM
jgi:hypothetical protein